MEVVNSLFFCRKGTSSCSKQSDLNTTDVVIMTSQLVNTNMPGGFECTLGKKNIHFCDILKYMKVWQTDQKRNQKTEGSKLKSLPVHLSHSKWKVKLEALHCGIQYSTSKLWLISKPSIQTQYCALYTAQKSMLV